MNEHAQKVLADLDSRIGQLSALRLDLIKFFSDGPEPAKIAATPPPGR